MRNALLGITGSIAAFKSVLLARELYKKGFNVRVVLTKNSKKFVSPLSFRELSGAKVFTDKEFFKGNTHIELSRWADIFLIVPATYNIIGKIANGIADDLLTSIAASYKGSIIFIPAMHTEMWRNGILKENIRKLKYHSHIVFPVETGELASGDYGEGRMVEVEEIVMYVEDMRKVATFWKNKKVVITYGGTVEKIDDVRVITNLSSGKMGTALASFLTSLGAYTVCVGCGNVEVAPSKEFYRAWTVNEVYKILSGLDYDYLFMAAAVSDYKPIYKRGKIKKQREKLLLELERTVDVIKEISKEKKGKIVGFTLEEKDKMVDEAKRKIREKNIDYIVANPTEVIGKDETEVILFSKDGKVGEFKGTKWEVAREIVKCLSLA